MGRKKKRSIRLNPFAGISLGLEEETKHGVLAVLFFVIALFLALSAFGYAGVAGDGTYSFLKRVFGAGYFLLPLSLFFVSVSFFRSERPNIVSINLIGGTFFLLAGLGLIEMGLEGQGGALGNLAAYPMLRFFGPIAGPLFLVGIALIAILIIFNTKFPTFGLGKKTDEEEEEEEDVNLTEEPEEEYEDEEYEEEEEEYEDEDEDDGEPEEEKKGVFGKLFNKGDDEADIAPQYARHGEYTPPPLSLLERDKGKPDHGDIKANANIIKRTLLTFGIEVEIDEVSVGPSFTRYAIKPAEGVRLSRIVALQNDLALALAAHPVRIEAPIPGKSLVGIEIPNTKKSTIGLASLISGRDFKESAAPLYVALGKNVTGAPSFSNVARAPHMLIAGSTGSGKSVTIHSLVTSLLYRNGPEHLRFIMIDPKRVELTLYKDIPHLLTPVITNPKKAILALKWAIKEMERRYSILETEQVRDIATYHSQVLDPALEKEEDDENLPEPMPYIVVIIDELADIMSSYPKELESAIVRLAQMSRAVGIHLILSTQRPSVNVVTGLIKANVPSRIALQVSSQVDSKTILDSAGAEKLLGAGDMLYQSGEMSKPVRLQSAFISEAEVKKVAKYLKKEYADELMDELDLEGVENGNRLVSVDLDNEDLEDEPEDDLYEDARDLVINTGKASTSYLQRKLGVGYARAARLIDMLEERGVVGPGQGSKPREVYESPIDEPEEEGEENNPNL
ncbi:cell division protein FtsK [bacterium]|nr:cell division protein FtsK [bacterium]|tara:strand:- start:3948 stop:6149 length:2202 start_codon:yes stop_codon:yes gene_type:complete